MATGGNDMFSMRKRQNAAGTAPRSGPWSYGLLVLVTTCVFAYSAYIRLPYLGRASEEGHYLNVAHALTSARIYFREGLFSTGLLFPMEPDSVEFGSGPAKRSFYFSYPMGCVLPLWAIGRVTGLEPTPESVMGWGLINHFLSTLILSLLVFRVVRQAGIPASRALIWSLLPVAPHLLLPGPLYAHYYAYFSDSSVVLLSVSLILLESWRDGASSGRARRGVAVAQFALMALGMYTDWQWAFIALLLYGKRLWCGQIGRGRSFFVRSAWFWLPVALSLGTFLVHVHLRGGWAPFFAKSLQRTGLAGENFGAASWMDFHRRFWGRWISEGYGSLYPWLYFLSLAVLLVTLCRTSRRGEAAPAVRQLQWVSALLLLPPLLKTYALSEHSHIHNFVAVTYGPALAAVPFVLAPILLWKTFWPARACPLGLPAVCAAVMLASVAAGHARWETFFPKTFVSTEAGAFLDRHAGYGDLVFSPDIECAGQPPMNMAMYMHRIYIVDTLRDVGQVIGRRSGDYSVKFLFLSEASRRDFLDGITLPPGATTVRQGAVSIVTLSRSEWARLLPAADAPSP
jgi:hypothetical protein